MNYQEFLEQKQDYGSKHGFTPINMPSFLFDFQVSLTTWAIELGRAAIFADCGMGKTPMQLVWADNVVRKTNKPVLILTPLAVSAQTLDEAGKFGIEAHRADVRSNPTAIQVTNYEKLHYFDAANYGGVVCDESSILKNFDGTRRGEITEFMRRIPYRLLCTATAAPNDWTEIGTSSEALGYLGHVDMLTRFFATQSNTISAKRFQQTRESFVLKAHAEQPFWRWAASWARACRRPADLGFDNDGFILPPLEERRTLVKASVPRQGMLFDLPAVNFFEEREVTKRTINDRCEAAAAKVAEHDLSIVWCHLNAEGDLLERLIPNCLQISGDDPEEYREIVIKWFKGETCICQNPRFRAKLLSWQTKNEVIQTTCANITSHTRTSGPKDVLPNSESDIMLNGVSSTGRTPSFGNVLGLKSKNGKQPTPESGMVNDSESMGLLLRNTTESLSDRAGDVQSADEKTQGIAAVQPSMSIIATVPERSEGYSVPTVIRASGSSMTTRSGSNGQRCICGHVSGIRRLVSKPQVLGFGLNLQCCSHMVYFPTHSYEQYYQATRRLWRFGQTKPVTVDLIYTDGGERMMENLARKAKAADKMFDDLTKYMNEALSVEQGYHPGPMNIPSWLTTGAK